MEDRFFNEDTGELNDTEIIKALRQAADDYENGEIEEVHDLLIEITNAIETFSIAHQAEMEGWCD